MVAPSGARSRQGRKGLEGVDGGQQVDGEAAVEGVEGLWVTPRAAPFSHGPRVEHGDGGAAHAVDLGEEEAQARGAARDDDDLVGEVDVARQAVGDARVDGGQGPDEGDEARPGDGHEHGRRGPVHHLGAEAEWDDPGDEGVEEGRLEDLEDEVDREGVEPGVIMGHRAIHGCCRGVAVVVSPSWCRCRGRRRDGIAVVVASLSTSS
ncbi:predicted protein [Verticillium alfalfae VaMs.102]|uniref:Predicted protein n=1 Tax=Verticillium alfalfae (strain VaMs.102 / ATCC MYA-4576 / FGSC 10136) TaxID=526221 RepID=C9SKR4_VERA1|nr:predicted protein [Verticillium alfalfae VaMs.102]EEY19282.1 predicted protein [Verticillium alfalfae VaMs.102]